MEHGNERIAIARHRQHVAVLIPWQDLDLLEILEDEVDAAEARIALSESRGRGLVTWTEVRKRAGLDR